MSANHKQSETNDAVRPFLRWAGGKRQLQATILAAFPADFTIGRNRYFEPFVGGGAVLMALPGTQFWSDKRPKTPKICINDANHELVNVYRVLRNQPKKLIEALKALSLDISSDRYYKVREELPGHRIDRAARFIYLNRLCFNGLHRVNSSGKFNVPYGKLKNPTVCDEQLLKAVTKILKFVEISEGGFENAVKKARRGDVVYFDPPYVPLSATASFSKYSVGDFNLDDQRRLAECIDGLVEKGVRVILSNSSARLTREIFQDSLELYAVKANRSISASGASRRPVDEILGLSYDLSESADPAALRHLRRLPRIALER